MPERKCSLCKEPGHYITTCEYRPAPPKPEPTLSEVYASVQKRVNKRVAEIFARHSKRNRQTWWNSCN